MPLMIFIRHIFKAVMVLLLLPCLFYMPARADIKAEFQHSIGYTDNLYVDTSYFEDVYNINKITVRVYPNQFLETKIYSDYTYYFKLIGLINYSGGIDVTLFPPNNEARQSLYVNGGYSLRSYHQSLAEFNTHDFRVNLGWGYKITERLRTRLGCSFKYTNYKEPNSLDSTNIQTAYNISRDTKNWEIIAGINLSFLNNNTIDIETGYEKMYLEFVDMPGLDTIVWLDENVIVQRDFLKPYFDSAEKGNYGGFYLSARYSRPIGHKTGLSVNYAYRKFDNVGRIILPRLANEFLSPWVSFYEGYSVTANLKTFIIPQLTLLAGIGYWDKNFLQTEHERTDFQYYSIDWQIMARDDQQFKAYCGIKKTYVFKTGAAIEVSLQYDYSDNDSSIPRYYYNSRGLTFGLIMRL